MRNPISKKTAVETAPTRSAARAVLSARIAARERAFQMIAEKQQAAKRLALIGEAAQALASQLAGVKASAAATLAAHVLSGSGLVPKLADDGRAEIAAKLAEVEARAEAAAPAMVQVEAEITSAIRALWLWPKDALVRPCEATGTQIAR